ncbi:MAG TPA: hypothetical protein VMU77_07500, partial [Acidimicrobiales bacterium]|nr:hypothetical protein [Acidimicrobiales bacterium]
MGDSTKSSNSNTHGQAVRQSFGKRLAVGTSILAVALAAVVAIGFSFGAAPSVASSGFVWTPPQLIDASTSISHPNSITSIACSYSGDCVVADNAGDVSASSNPLGGIGAWSHTRVDGQNPIYAISCIGGATSLLCVAGDSLGNAVVSTSPGSGPAAWSLASIDPAKSINSVSCPTTSMCVAGDDGGNVLVSTSPTGGTTAWTKTNIDGTNTIMGLSCPTTTYCMAVDNLGNAFAYNGTNWTAATTWVNPIDSAISITSVSCISPSLCVAGDSSGNVLAFNGTSWSAPVNIAGTFSLKVSCVIGCMAVDSYGNFYGIAHPLAMIAVGAAAWHSGTAEAAIALNAVACTGSGICVAGDGQGRIVTTSGPMPPVYAVPTPITPPTTTSSVSCATVSFCEAVDV